MLALIGGKLCGSLNYALVQVDAGCVPVPRDGGRGGGGPTRHLHQGDLPTFIQNELAQSS
jgi:hypothetical protein